ncbi:MAG TPA: NAD-dependent epimerase/dehydratase family protein [Dongiaceae bacterium]|nr:NAD-dependent epimerase/dehydratase family protein [Dongiaceae bacterium]
MKVLITGATGYLGARVARTLVAGGHDVRVLCRPGREAAVPAGCVPVTGDLLDASALRAALAGCQALVHMAAMVKRWARDRAAFDRVNVEGTERILALAAEAGTPRIVYTSSIVAIGPTDGSIGDESRPPATAPGFTDYERTKRISLARVRARLAAGQPIVVVYPGIVFGPGAATEGNLIGPVLDDYRRGRLHARLGRDDLRICYAYAEDVARGHLLALERGRPGPGYILGGANLTQRDLFMHLAALTGRPAPRIVVPYRLGEWVGGLQILRARLTGHPPEVTPGVVRTFRHEWAYRSDRAAAEIGYTMTPPVEALGATLTSMSATAAAAGPRDHA